jgi:hypothetical protein
LNPRKWVGSRNSPEATNAQSRPAARRDVKTDGRFVLGHDRKHTADGSGEKPARELGCMLIAGQRPSVYPLRSSRSRRTTAIENLAAFVQSVRQGGATVGIVASEIDVLLGGPHLERYEQFMLQAHEHGLPIWEVADALPGHRSGDLT